jgi:uncharacterized membrane protein YqhA
MSATRLLALVGVVFSLLAAAASFVVGGAMTLGLLRSLVVPGRHTAPLRVELVGLMDVFLVAAALLLFALGLHQLFVGELELPAPLVVGSLEELKGRLAGIVVLVLAVDFLEHFVGWENGMETLLHAAALALVAASLVAMVRLGARHG